MGGAELKMSRIEAGVVHNYGILIDELHFPKGCRMQILPKLDLCFTNKIRLGIKDLGFTLKAGGGNVFLTSTC